MFLTDARRRARSVPDGMLVPLADQDRGLWDSAQIAEGLELLPERQYLLAKAASLGQLST